MDSNPNARRLRREQTEEQKQLGQALRAGRLAGFKFRRPPPVGTYCLDLYCPLARRSIELDGFQHGLPTQRHPDQERSGFLADRDIEERRFWNRQRRHNRQGVRLEIWRAVHRRSGGTQVERKTENRRFVPPQPNPIAPLSGSLPASGEREKDFQS